MVNFDSDKKPNSLPKQYMLKGKSVFKLINDQGLRGRFYPIGIVYLKNGISHGSNTRIGVRVSKKRIKRAVDRNCIRRRIKEAYRKNKSLVIQPGNQSYNIIFVYLSHEPLSFHEIEHSVRQALLFLNAQES